MYWYLDEHGDHGNGGVFYRRHLCHQSPAVHLTVFSHVDHQTKALKVRQLIIRIKKVITE